MVVVPLPVLILGVLQLLRGDLQSLRHWLLGPISDLVIAVIVIVALDVWST